MQPRWVRWTVIGLVVLLALALGLSVVPFEGTPGDGLASSGDSRGLPDP